MQHENFTRSKSTRHCSRRWVVCILQKTIQRGTLVLNTPQGVLEFGGNQPGRHATVHIANDKIYRQLLLRGIAAIEEAYFREELRCDDMVNLIAFAADNLPAMPRWTRLLRQWSAYLYYLPSQWLRNTPTSNRQFIAAHYDLGNDFFRQFLDSSMLYSAAIFPHPQSTLADAQQHKMRLIAERAALKPGDTVLEIGSGWGAFALFAAARYGCQVTTITLSQEQFNYVQQQIKAHELTDRVTIQLIDYRQIQGQYDKVISIEMIEAVGWRYLPIFMRQVNDLLKVGGDAFLQAILMNDRHYPVYKYKLDFIRRYIFPGGCLPSLYALQRIAARETTLDLVHVADHSAHYVRTLQAWRARFVEKLGEIEQLGYSTDFLRRWQYYLQFSEAGFTTQHIRAMHLQWQKMPR